tara:strand:+ start:1312 stop:2106 length:795 start_codon:yes stop_codon:yes gene_type:complete
MPLDSQYSVLAFSGGMDSTSLLLNLLKNNQYVYAISFNYGQKHIIEIERASKNIDYLTNNGFKDKVVHKVFDLSDAFKNFNSSITDKKQRIPEGHYESENMKSTFVPNRNAIFSSFIYGFSLSLAQKISKKVSVSIGAHSGDHEIYPDCRLDFFKQLFHAFEIGNWDSDKIDLYLPYIDMDKKDILLDAQNSIDKLGLDFNTIFKNTITSYNPAPNGLSSGKSGSDIERILAFNKINKKDPIAYQDSWENVVKYALGVEKEFNK